MGSSGGSVVVAQAEGGSETVIRGEPGFDELIEPYRTELFAHCYRMLGSVHDAEDVVQEAYLRAWRARDQYDASRSSVRTWMYRIATNACLTALSSRSRRPLPSGFVVASDPLQPLVRGKEVTWLQPLPDAALLDSVDPARSAVKRDGLRLAFMAALQNLSARQRAVLILRDVLEFSAAEAADILGATVISVNSSLRRARASVEASGAHPDSVNEPSEADQRVWIERYMRAFVEADIEALKQLLAEDVLMEMPPMLNWFVGRHNYGLFMEWVFGAAGTDWRLESVSANGQPGFAAYRRNGETYALHTVQLFAVGPDGITRNSVFQDDDVFACFGLPFEVEP
jgi:RNA polymerase sigma-70 factor (ECF subfamily)